MSEVTLTADCESVLALTNRFVLDSRRYRAADPHGRKVADGALARVTAELTSSVDGYKAGVRKLMFGGWLTPIQAAVLVSFADSL